MKRDVRRDATKAALQHHLLNTLFGSWQTLEPHRHAHLHAAPGAWQHATLDASPGDTAWQQERARERDGGGRPLASLPWPPLDASRACRHRRGACQDPCAHPCPSHHSRESVLGLRPYAPSSLRNSSTSRHALSKHIAHALSSPDLNQDPLSEWCAHRKPQQTCALRAGADRRLPTAHKHNMQAALIGHTHNKQPNLLGRPDRPWLALKGDARP